MKKMVTITAALLCMAVSALEAETLVKEMVLPEASKTVVPAAKKAEAAVITNEVPVKTDPAKTMIRKLEDAKAYGSVLASQKPNFDERAFKEAIDEMVAAISTL